MDGHRMYGDTVVDLRLPPALRSEPGSDTVPTVRPPPPALPLAPPPPRATRSPDAPRSLGTAAGVALCAAALVLGTVAAVTDEAQAPLALSKGAPKAAGTVDAAGGSAEARRAVARPQPAQSTTVKTPGPARSAVALPSSKESTAEREAQVERLVRRGRHFQSQSRWHRARSAYERALSMDPHHPVARAHLARVLLRLDRSDEALSLAQGLHRAEPERFGYLVLLGDAQLAVGDELAARRSWLRASWIRPRHRALEQRL